ncbi:MAG: hypothetical protein IKO42_02170, partial [Opitutales bacterium]|nr:hypothetical protein [Opitutales bacterium]
GSIKKHWKNSKTPPAKMKTFFCKKNLFYVLNICAAALALCACAPKTNPVERLRDTTWEPIFTKGSAKAKKPSDEAHKPFLYFAKDLKITMMAGEHRANAEIRLERKKIKRSECKLEWQSLSIIQKSNSGAEEFIEYEGIFISDLQQADAIRLHENKLEFLKGKKLMLEFKRVPNFLGRAQKARE